MPSPAPGGAARASAAQGHNGPGERMAGASWSGWAGPSRRRVRRRAVFSGSSIRMAASAKG
eukprot:6285430-Lingulodinium_polyedra.AAC.1